MKRRISAFFLCIFMITGSLAMTAAATGDQEDIVILYENDVHCQIDGYSKLAAMKNELLQTHAHVGVVSSGDYIQGASIGVVSQGEYIVKLMNLVGYDALTLGNHEFDYHLPRLEELVDMMDTKPVCCNFQKLGDQAPYFEPYTMVAYGDVQIAYVGVTTPATMTSTSPAQFKDETGEFIFTFHPEELYSVVQETVDEAIAAGADYVIALTHMGDQELTYDVQTFIANTQGIDVVLDAHSHSVIEERIMKNSAGEDVVLSSTGTKFEHIGKLTISKDKLQTELIKTEDYLPTDPAVDAYLAQIEQEYAVLGDRVVAASQVHLITHDADGNRLVRVAETNLGDLCAEAFRSAVDADIGYINGGSIRSDIPAGEVTFNHLLNVLPFNNTVVLAEIDGSAFRDMLEMAMMAWPEEGSFPHLSGVTFSMNTQIPTSVVLNELEEFCGVSGQYRVYDIRIFNREKGKYEPLEMDKTYTIASNNYYLLEYGSGMTMLEKVKILKNDGMLDVEALERYLVEDLDGQITERYAEVSPNITFTEGELTGPGAMQVALMIVCAAAAAAAVTLAALWIVKKGRSPRQTQ